MPALLERLCSGLACIPSATAFCICYQKMSCQRKLHMRCKHFSFKNSVSIGKRFWFRVQPGRAETALRFALSLFAKERKGPDRRLCQTEPPGCSGIWPHPATPCLALPCLPVALYREFTRQQRCRSLALAQCNTCFVPAPAASLFLIPFFLWVCRSAAAFLHCVHLPFWLLHCFCLAAPA